MELHSLLCPETTLVICCDLSRAVVQHRFRCPAPGNRVTLLSPCCLALQAPSLIIAHKNHPRSLTSSLLLPPYLPPPPPLAPGGNPRRASAAGAGPTDGPPSPFSPLRLFACLKRARASGFFWRLDIAGVFTTACRAQTSIRPGVEPLEHSSRAEYGKLLGGTFPFTNYEASKCAAGGDHTDSAWCPLAIGNAEDGCATGEDPCWGPGCRLDCWEGWTVSTHRQ